MESKTLHTLPPVVSVLGHVDHGKTTLLDTIRKSNIASRETGGITQKIGASQIEIMHEGNKRKITFIDTPGHEAFSNMRSHGVSAADIVLLIVAADDGIKPQTRESIRTIQESGIPYIVVITKSDLETAQLEKVKQQLLSEGVLLEGLGGDVPFIAVSAKTNLRIQELLDLILLVHDVKDDTRSEEKEFSGVVIESKLDKRRGNVATLVVKNGILKYGDKVFIHSKEVGKVKALFDSNGKGIKNSYPGDACEILGLTEVLEMGSVIYNSPQDAVIIAPDLTPTTHTAASFAALFAQNNSHNVSVVLKTETSGELEAIKNSLPENVIVIYEGQGDINVSDVLMAKDFKALVLGFNVNMAKDAEDLAKNEKVFYKTYKIIYELLDELIEVIEALQEEERLKCKAEIIASFDGNEDKILGLRILEGRLVVGDQVELKHGDTIVGKSRISSLKRGKQDVKDVTKNLECGATITPALDFEVGDMILSHNIKG